MCAPSDDSTKSFVVLDREVDQEKARPALAPVVRSVVGRRAVLNDGSGSQLVGGRSGNEIANSTRNSGSYCSST